VLRNVIIFYAGALLLAVAGCLIALSGQDIGLLLFVLSPIIMVLVVRWPLGDGWKDAGLALRLAGSWRWYLFALLLYPVVYVLAIAANVLLGWSRLGAPAAFLLPALLGGFAAQLLPRMAYALFEEWGWRGYLEPRFSLLGIPPLRRHLIVGALWGIWHFPLILWTPYTTSPMALFLPLFMVGILLMALIYGRMRSSSQTVWPAVLMHGMGNALGFSIIQGKLLAYDSDVLGHIFTGSLMMSLLYALIVLAMWRRTDQRPARM